MASNRMKDEWTEKIEELFAAHRLTSHQCRIYGKNSRPEKANEICGCQRSIRHHSFDGVPLTTRPKPEDWNVLEHTVKLPKLIYHSTTSHKVSSPYPSLYTSEQKAYFQICLLVFTMCV